MAEIMEGLRLIPPVTRHFMLAAAAVTLPALLALVDLRRFGFYWPYLTKDFELWRLATAFLYAGQGLPLLFDAFLFHRTSAGLETETYLLDSARYGWSLLWIAAFIQLGNVFYFHAWFLFRPFMIGLVHLWARHNASVNVSLFGLISVPAIYYPPFLLFVDLLQAGPGAFMLGCSGVIAAHLYWFLTTNPTTAASCRLLSEPPQWWRRSFAAPPGQVRTGAGTAMGGGGAMGGRGPAAAAAAAGTGGHNWGSGNRLGR